MNKTTLSLALLNLIPVLSFADEVKTLNAVADLGVIEITVQKQQQHSLAFADSQKASDMQVEQKVLQQRSSTLGNALAGELGIHSNPFGGGASAPVVRGQEGVRVKVLQNGLGVSDMSTISPDHAVAVDTLLANRVEVVRGASTLMYSNASPAGVINVIDGRIPSVMPDQITGEAMLRFNTGSDEKLTTAGLSVPIGSNFVLRVEGMVRDANPYNVPAINFGDLLNYLPDSYNKSRVGTIGASYIGEKGYIGASYSQRLDDYGLVGHNHKFDHCSGHVLNTSNTSLGRAYLNAYPHLMGDEDLIDSLHFHCGTDYDLDPKHSHEHVYGHKHDHSQKGPWVDMNVQTFAIAGELKQPVKSVDKVSLKTSYSEYEHAEFDEGKSILSGGRQTFIQGNPVLYANRGLAGKLSIHQSLTDRLKFVWGLDYQSNKTHALIPSKKEKESNRRPLVENHQHNTALFALSEYQLDKLKFHLGGRVERSKIPISYNLDEINAQIKIHSETAPQQFPDLSTYRNKATSYAFGAMWDILPSTRLDLSYSHNERIPTPLELYYHGKHLATNSFLYGNKNLDKEQSDNLELGLHFRGDAWGFKGSIYKNWFDNYIHPENLYKHGNLAMRRFIQSKAKIHGFETEVSYYFPAGHRLSLFGDYVRGRLSGFAPIIGNNILGEPYTCTLTDEYGEYEDECRDVIGKDTVTRPDRDAPRMSPLRYGIKFNGEHGEHWSSSLEYTRVRKQDRISTSVATKYDSECAYHDVGHERLCPIYINEDKTTGYHLLNAGVDYRHHWGKVDYTWSFRANNVLNEKVYVHNSFLPFVPQQGRNYSLGLHIKF